jgi:hypothetical protein
MSVERIQDMPPGTLGFRAKGEIEREDYEDVLVPDLHAAIAGGRMARATRLFLWMIPGEARATAPSAAGSARCSASPARRSRAG